MERNGNDTGGANNNTGSMRSGNSQTTLVAYNENTGPAGGAGAAAPLQRYSSVANRKDSSELVWTLSQTIQRAKSIGNVNNAVDAVDAVDVDEAEILANLSILILPEDVYTQLDSPETMEIIDAMDTPMKGGSRRIRVQRGGNVMGALGRIIMTIRNTVGRFGMETDAALASQIDARAQELAGLSYTSMLTATFTATGVLGATSDAVTGSNTIATLATLLCDRLLPMLPDPTMVMKNTLVSLSKYFAPALLVGQLGLYLVTATLCILLVYVIRQYLFSLGYSGANALINAIREKGLEQVCRDVLTAGYALLKQFTLNTSVQIVRRGVTGTAYNALMYIPRKVYSIPSMWRSYWNDIEKYSNTLRSKNAAERASGSAHVAGDASALLRIVAADVSRANAASGTNVLTRRNVGSGTNTGGSGGPGGGGGGGAAAAQAPAARAPEGRGAGNTENYIDLNSIPSGPGFPQARGRSAAGVGLVLTNTEKANAIRQSQEQAARIADEAEKAAKAAEAAAAAATAAKGGPRAEAAAQAATEAADDAESAAKAAQTQATILHPEVTAEEQSKINQAARVLVDLYRSKMNATTAPEEEEEVPAKRRRGAKKGGSRRRKLKSSKRVQTRRNRKTQRR
jgi:hypothetical protein